MEQQLYSHLTFLKTLLKITIFCLLISPLQSFAEINVETHDFSFEYGLSYHTVKSKQKNNNTQGQLSSNQLPYWIGAYTLRLSQNFGVRTFGGIHVLRFEEPKYGNLVSEFDSLNHFGFELIWKTGPNTKLGFFGMQQDHPLYRAIGPSTFEVFKLKFAQSGFHFQIGQRRRIGMLWGLGLKAYALFPTRGGDVVTETGAGGEALARLGWVGPFGTLHQVKGFYQISTQPNAEVDFTHDILGYCYQVSYSF